MSRGSSATSVDDILLASTSQHESDDVTKNLGQIFDLTDNGDVQWLLGCKVTRARSRGTIRLTQETYTESILREFGMEHCNAVSTPLPPKTTLSEDDCARTPEEKAEVKDLEWYASQQFHFQTTIEEFASMNPAGDGFHPHPILNAVDLPCGGEDFAAVGSQALM